MKRVVFALTALFAVALLAAPSASAAASTSPPQSSTPSVVRPPTPPYMMPPVPAPDVSPVVEQFAFLGYKVSQKAVNGKPSSKDRSEIKRFQSKFGVKQTGKADKATLKALTKYAGSAVVPTRCVTGKWTLCADKYARVLRVIGADGNVVRVRDVRFGGRGLETRNGTFAVYRKSKNHISTQYHVPMPDALFFSGGQAVHFSYEFAQYHYARPNSHGCIGAYDRSFTTWLFDGTPVGSPVIVYDHAPL